MTLMNWSWIFLAFYVGIMVFIGVFAQRKIKHADDFAKYLFTCPKCGHENLTSSPDCINCGISFEIYRKEKNRAQPSTEKMAAQGVDHTPDRADSLANCPNCDRHWNYENGIYDFRLN